jgi:hypothetical protein
LIFYSVAETWPEEEAVVVAAVRVETVGGWKYTTTLSSIWGLFALSADRVGGAAKVAPVKVRPVAQDPLRMKNQARPIPGTAAREVPRKPAGDHRKTEPMDSPAT